MFVDYRSAATGWTASRLPAPPKVAVADPEAGSAGDHALLRSLPLALPLSLLMWATIWSIGHLIL